MLLVFQEKVYETYTTVNLFSLLNVSSRTLVPATQLSMHGLAVLPLTLQAW